MNADEKKDYNKSRIVSFFSDNIVISRREGYIGSMRKGLLFLAAVVLVGTASLSAQTKKPVIKMLPFFSQGIGLEETHLIESLVQSYLSDFGEVINYFDTSLLSDPFAEIEDNFDSWTKIPDYTFSGSITVRPDNLVFKLDIGKTASGETSSYTLSCKSMAELALKARSLIESAFVLAPDLTKTQKPVPVFLSESGVTGTWRGETGVELIRLQPGGRGIAIFSSGAQMLLAWAIENDTLTVRQASPNAERYYHPLPYGVAKQLVDLAEPMAWELLLYEQGSILRGTRIATGVRFEGETIIELLPAEGRDSEWIRVNR
jgi:hypothetical protein